MGVAGEDGIDSRTTQQLTYQDLYEGSLKEGQRTMDNCQVSDYNDGVCLDPASDHDLLKQPTLHQGKPVKSLLLTDPDDCPQMTDLPRIVLSFLDG